MLDNIPIALVVDDNAAMIRLFSDILQRDGYRVLRARNSDEAMDVFQMKPKCYDLVIVDFRIPGMMGDELATRIRDIRSDIPIILCTGDWCDLTTQDLEDSGIRALLKKPFRAKELRALAREVRSRR